MPKIAAAVTSRSEAKHIDLASAENWLIRPEVIEICKEAIINNLNPVDFSYPRAFAGYPEILDAFSAFLNTHFHPKIPVEISHIATAPGAASCIDTLLYNICDPGDGLLVPGPYWSGFDFQFKARSSVVPVAVVMASLDSTLLTSALVPALEAAFDDATIPIRGLLMSNPQNPFGQCYSRDCIEECIRFCERRNIHYISDEVYAMTNFPCPEIREPIPFISALSLDITSLGCDLSRVHTVWSTSKDFGQSGFRMVG
jgi:aspartate/methionine/tyrosine aminotransferase